MGCKIEKFRNLLIIFLLAKEVHLVFVSEFIPASSLILKQRSMALVVLAKLLSDHVRGFYERRY